jgi:hypothetical protein
VKNPKHWNDMEVFLFTSLGLEGSRFPKSRADVWVVNRQNPLDITVAVTDTEPESAEYPMPPTIKIEKVMIAIRPVFN